MSLRQPHIRAVVPALLICLAVAAGAVAVFPMMDDAWLLLLRAEAPAQAVRLTLPERPLYGILLEAAASPLRNLLWIGPATNFLFWSIFGYQAASLWRFWFPRSSRYAAIAACFSVAPIAVQTQLSTLTTTLPVNLPILCVLAACLLLIPFVQSNRRPMLSVAGSASLIFIAGVISEYAFVTCIAIAFIIAWHAGPAHPRAVRRRAVQSLGLVGICVLASAIVFRLTVIDPRPNFTGVSVLPSVRHILGDLGHYAILVPSSLAYVVAGAYGTAAGQIWISHLDRATMAALLFASMIGLAMLWACRRPDESHETTGAPSCPPPPAWLLVASTMASLLPAVLIGMFPVGRDGHWEEFSTRYFTAALPFAAVCTTALLTQFLAPRYWYLPVLSVGFLAGYTTVHHIASTYRHRQSIAAMGTALFPYVDNSSDFTVAIVPDYYGRDAEMTWGASKNWPIEDRKRLWILWEDRIPAVLGHPAGRTRENCPTIDVIDRNLRMVMRRGRIAHLLWLEPDSKGNFTAEPYCAAL